MKLREFNYTKPGAGVEPREVMVFNDDGKYLEGIDLTKLSPAEVADLKKVTEEYEAKISAYVSKAWRRFKHDNMS